MKTKILEIKNLTKRFGGLTAVSGLDFEVREGEILGMIGPNGAGKSTTFNLIAGTFPASAGEVRFAGESILGLPPHRIAARGVLRTFQHNRPFAGMSVVENVLVGAHTRFGSGIFSAKAREQEAQRRRRAEELIDFVGLGDVREAEVIGVVLPPIRHVGHPMPHDLCRSAATGVTLCCGEPFPAEVREHSHVGSQRPAPARARGPRYGGAHPPRGARGDRVCGLAEVPRLAALASGRCGCHRSGGRLGGVPHR